VTMLVHLSSLTTSICLKLLLLGTESFYYLTDRFYRLIYWLLLLLTPLLAATFTDCSLLPSLSLISCIVLFYTEHHVQLFRCGFNGLCDNFRCHELAFYSLSEFLRDRLLYLTPRNCCLATKPLSNHSRCLAMIALYYGP
jgi:hypothetical protein